MAQFIIMTILIVVLIMQLLGRCVASLSDTLLQYCARQYWYILWWAVKCSIDCQCLKWRSSAGPVLTVSYSDLLSATSSSVKFPVCADNHIKRFLPHFDTVMGC
jgi:hypothetical protein